MRSPSPVSLLVLLLLVGASNARAQPRPCETAVRRIELAATGSASPVEVCVSPGLSTTLLFDSALAASGVVLEDVERFQRMEVADRLLVLVPSERLKPGERLRLEVRFEAGGPPTSATFVLAVHAAQAERQVEIVRPRRTPETSQEELQRKEGELQQCREQLGRCSTGPQAPPSLGQLIVERILEEGSLKSRRLSKEELKQPPEQPIRVEEAILYRSNSRLVVRLRVKSTGAPTHWVLEGAEQPGMNAEAAQQALWLHQSAPLPPGGRGLLWAEMELPTEAAGGLYSLTLWDVGGVRPITLQGLKLP